MIITKQQLQKLINEEFSRAIQRRKKVTESYDDYPPEMDYDLMPGEGSNEPCPRCGGTNTHQEEPIPSMLGYGEEQQLTCDDCAETFAEDPLDGGYGVPRKTEGRQHAKRRLVETPLGNNKIHEAIAVLADAIMEWVTDDVENNYGEITNEKFVAGVRDGLVEDLTDHVMNDLAKDAHRELESLSDERFNGYPPEPEDDV